MGVAYFVTFLVVLGVRDPLGTRGDKNIGGRDEKKIEIKKFTYEVGGRFFILSGWGSLACAVVSFLFGLWRPT